MGNESLEALIVIACQPINGEASEGSTYATQVVGIDVRLFGHCINGSEVVLHALTHIVATDFFVPLVAKSRQTTTVRSYDDIVVGSHHLEVPAIAPELANRALRTAFAEEQGRIFLVRIELRRIDHPYQHVLVVGGLDPTAFHLAHLYLVVNGLVLESHLLHLSKSISWAYLIELIDLVAHHHAVTLGEQFVATQRQRTEVVVALGQLGQLVAIGNVYIIYVCLSVPNTCEEESL